LVDGRQRLGPVLAIIPEVDLPLWGLKPYQER